MTRGKLIKALRLSPERAELLCLNSFDFRGVPFWFKAISPLDFVDSKTHPFMIYRQGADVVEDRKNEAKAREIDMTDPEKVKELQLDLRLSQGRVFMKAVLWPKITETEVPDAVCLDDIFAHIEEANGLWMAIVQNSVKKKTRFIYRLKKLWSWIGWRGGMASSPLKSPA